jgi:hypothetical protein
VLAPGAADLGQRSRTVRRVRGHYSTADSPRNRPIVSVLTPTRLSPRREGFLCDLHADLTASGVDFEWIIAVDGTQRRRVPEPIVADQRTRVLEIGRQVGAAAARNLALGLARGAYVTSADDDDHLPAGSLTTRLEAALRYGVGWVAGALADLYGEKLTPSDLRLPTGAVAPGDVWRAWGCPCLAFPVGPTTLLVETGLLRRVGGWQGLPQAEDLGMVLSVTAHTAGIMLDTVVYAYRKHAHQMTTSKEFGQLEPLVRHITYERGRLLAAPRVPDSPPPDPTGPSKSHQTFDQAAIA